MLGFKVLDECIHRRVIELPVEGDGDDWPDGRVVRGQNRRGRSRHLVSCGIDSCAASEAQRCWRPARAHRAVRFVGPCLELKLIPFGNSYCPLSPSTRVVNLLKNPNSS